MKRVETFKRPGAGIDRGPPLSPRAGGVGGKAQRRTSLSKRLKGFAVRPDILTAVHRSLSRSTPQKSHSDPSLRPLQSCGKEKGRLLLSRPFTAPSPLLSAPPVRRPLQSTSGQKENLQKPFHSHCRIHFKHGRMDGRRFLMQLCTPALIYLGNCLCIFYELFMY